MSQLGHRHDWEWVAAVWKRCNGNGDFWCRDRLVRSFHKSNKSNNWDGIQNTVNEPSQVGDLGQKNKHHPLSMFTPPRLPSPVDLNTDG